MADAPAQAQQQQKVGMVPVVGKIVSVRKAGNLFEHLVKMAAPDLYSSPATLSILSNRRLGSAEEDFRQVCRLTGYSRSYKKTDQETGEVSNVKTADNKLFVD